MYKHVFGPVPSRRLGISLGVDLVVSKSCNLNCIFCECGATKKIQLKRQRFKDMNEILNEIQSVLKDIKPDYITFSGSGEPTLSLDLGNISKAIKENLKYKGKICLITNSLLLADKQVIKELEYIDLIIPTLNTLRQDIFEKIVRPDYRTSVDEIRKGFINLNNSNYKGKIWIEIFILENISPAEMRAPVIFRSNHASNFLMLRGTLPDDRAALLAQVNAILKKGVYPTGRKYFL